MVITSCGNASNLKESNDGIEAIASPECINDLDGRFFVDAEPTPKDTFYMIVRHQDNSSAPGNAVSLPVHYDASIHTGFKPPEPYEKWQLGKFDDASSASSVYQLHCKSGGIHMNSWDTTWKPVVGGGPNTIYAYEFSEPAFPWAEEGSELQLQANLQLPYFELWDINKNEQKPVGQLSYVIYLHDHTIPHAIAVVMNIFDHRQMTPVEAVLHDTGVSFASTFFGGTRYLTPASDSGEWTNQTWKGWKLYRAVMTKDNLLNIVTDINKAHSTHLSLNPADYKLTAIGIMQETFREEGDQVSMSSSFSDFGAYRVTVPKDRNE